MPFFPILTQLTHKVDEVFEERAGEEKLDLSRVVETNQTIHVIL